MSPRPKYRGKECQLMAKATLPPPGSAGSRCRRSRRAWSTRSAELSARTRGQIRMSVRRAKCARQASIWARVARTRCGPRSKFSPYKAPISAAPSKQTVENTQVREYYLSHQTSFASQASAWQAGWNERWSHFLRQAVKLDSATERTIHHEDARTVFGRVPAKLVSTHAGVAQW
jgi:hypothetical protein